MNKETDAQKRYEKKVIDSAKTNHIWVNAFSIIRPTDEIKKEIGEMVLGMWARRENRIKSPMFEDAETMAGDQIIIRFNAS